MRLKYLPLLLILTACNITIKKDSKPEEVSGTTVATSDATGVTGAIIQNDLDIEASGVKLAEAYLMNEQRQLKQDNSAAVNEKVLLVVKLDTGWVKKDGKSFIGASERITTPDGKVVLDAPDLFKDYENSGIDPELTKLVSISAVITKKQPGVNDYHVSFKVWDKLGNGFVKGKYVLKVK